MKRERTIAIAVISALIAIPASLWALIGPIRDFSCRRNTVYSSDFSQGNFALITNGMSQEKVASLIGEPLFKTSPPGWAGCSLRYYSRSKDNFGDYERAMVIIATNGAVYFHEMCITD